MLCEKLVDTPRPRAGLRGRGVAGDDVLAGGAEIVRRAAATWSIPVEVVSEDPPAACADWTADAVAAVERLLA